MSTDLPWWRCVGAPSWRHTYAFDDTVAGGCRVLENRGVQVDADRLALVRGDYCPGCGPFSERPLTGSLTCGGSGSTRSPTSATTEYLTVVVDRTPAGLCGPLLAGTHRHLVASMSWAHSGALNPHVSATDTAEWLDRRWVNARCPDRDPVCRSISCGGLGH